jgi:hypothetical protein
MPVWQARRKVRLTLTYGQKKYPRMMLWSERPM